MKASMHLASWSLTWQLYWECLRPLETDRQTDVLILNFMPFKGCFCGRQGCQWVLFLQLKWIEILCLSTTTTNNNNNKCYFTQMVIPSYNVNEEKKRKWMILSWKKKTWKLSREDHSGGQNRIVQHIKVVLHVSNVEIKGFYSFYSAQAKGRGLTLKMGSVCFYYSAQP